MNRTWKAIIIAATVFLLSMTTAGSGSVFAGIVRKDLPILYIQRRATFVRPDSSCSLQGGTATPSGYVLSFLKNSSTNNNLTMKLDMNSWQSIKTGQNPMSHANDMCYVPTTGELYVTPMSAKKFIVLDGQELTWKREIKVPQKYHAIGYDPDRNSFAAIYESGSGAGRHLVCDILDSTCQNVTGSFHVDSNLTYQGMTIRNSQVYYSFWEKGATSKYEPVYDGIFQRNDNLIYVYDYAGNLVKTYLVPSPEGYFRFELEALSFLGDQMFLQFNERMSSYGVDRIGVYAVVGEGKPASQIEKERAELARQAANAEKQTAAAEKKEQEAYKKALKKFKKTKAKFSKVKRSKRSIKLTWKTMKVGSEAVTGYEIQICQKKKFKGKTLKTFKTEKQTCTITGLKRKKTYYVRIRAYYSDENDKTSYSKWSKTKAVRTK